MTNFKELIEKEVEKQANEISGYKKFPRARFDFTKERAEEFARTPVETLIDDPYFLGLK